MEESVMQDFMERAATIKLAVFDVDGVLTDGRIYIDSQGNESKAFHVQDGLGLVMLRNAGIEVAIITSRQSTIVSKRCDELGIEHVFQGVGDKLTCLQALQHELKLHPSECVYVGDDLVDLPVMQTVGLSVAVANAVDRVKQLADWVCAHSGGNGAAREVCEMLLLAQDKLDEAEARYLTLKQKQM